MVRLPRLGPLTWLAFAASLAVHVGVAFFIPALAWTAAASTPVETISFVRITRMRIEPRPHPAPQPRAEAPRRKAKPAVVFASQVELAHATRRRNASPPPAISRQNSSAPTVASLSAAGQTTGAPSSVPQPTPTPVVQAVASAPRHEGGTMPFTAEQPDPVLDPEVRKQLATLGVHVTLLVTVDEDGHTKTVAFEPPVDPAMQARIQTLLADANWDPAVCGGGISCEGRATIKL